MARQHAGTPGTTVIGEGHKEVINIRTAGAASKCSASNAIQIRILIRPSSSQTIRIRPNNLKPLIGTPTVVVTLSGCCRSHTSHLEVRPISFDMCTVALSCPEPVQ